MFKNSRANKSALHPCNQFIVDKFIQLERQQQMRGAANLNFTYSKIIKSLQKYPLPLLSRQQALSLENVGDKMANLIYGLIKAHYKDYVKNQNQDYEEALHSGSDDGINGKSKNGFNQNSKSNSECSSKNSTNLFQKPSNSFSSKLLIKDSKNKELDDDLPKDFKGINNTIKNSNKKKPKADEECKKNGGQKIILLLSEDEQDQKIGGDNTLFNILSQYVPTESNKLQSIKNEKFTEEVNIEDLQNKLMISSISEHRFGVNLNGGENMEEDEQIQQQKSERISKKKDTDQQINGKSSVKKPQQEIIMEVDRSITNKSNNNLMISENDEDEEDALNFQNQILTSFQSSKSKVQKQSYNGAMKKIMVDSDQESTLPQNKESLSSSKKSSMKPLNGNASFLSDSEDQKLGQQAQENQSKKKRKFNPKEYSNNWAILISLFCLREEHKKNSATMKDIKARAKSISEEIDHQFSVKSFAQIDSLVTNNLVITYSFRFLQFIRLFSTLLDDIQIIE